MGTGQSIVAAALSDGRTNLTEIESKQIISEEAVEVIETRLARTKSEAVSIAREIGFPVAVKVISAQIVHKSDVGGVRLDLQNGAQVARAFGEIKASVKEAVPGARIDGVTVQKMARPGVEVIMGMSKDAQFGPVLMFGLGGVLVEVLKDVSFRIVPLARRDARQMIEEIRGYPVLMGYRGQEPASISGLEDTLLRLSRFIERTPEIKELDLNPMIASGDGLVAVDARIILESVKN